MSEIQQQLAALESHLGERIIGQASLVNRLLLSLLANGHLLVEGAPGLAKTTAIKTLSRFVEGDFHRIQFTPDLLPADLTGTDIYRPQDSSFVFNPGPLFHNLLLADEINRAPAKVQSALLEAMAERQVTVGAKTYPLPDLFLVMATQNPIEQEGTYPLPEAQLDRFLLHVFVDYPDVDAERRILRLNRNDDIDSVDKSPVGFISQADLFAARKAALAVHLSDDIEHYLIRLIDATRTPMRYDDELARWLRYGVSPRGTIALDRCARAHAWLAGRDYVSPEDVHAIAPDVLRHRLLVSFEAEADGITRDRIINRLLDTVSLP